MTCIVGLVDSGKVIIGGDSAGVRHYDITIRKDPKVGIIEVGDHRFVVGYSSSFRAGQVLLHNFRPQLEHLDNTDLDTYTYMVSHFVEELRECFKNHGIARKREEIDSQGSEFLVGFRSRLFIISYDYQVGESHCGFSATGSGMIAALGSLHTTMYDSAGQGMARVKSALEAAEFLNCGVSAPFTILRI